jgi:hypothetical protein
MLWFTCLDRRFRLLIFKAVVALTEIESLVRVLANHCIGTPARN